jgi:hypothetical protein
MDSGSVVVSIRQILEQSSGTTAEHELVGTYKLITTTQTILKTGQVVAMNDSGFITYGWSHDVELAARMMFLSR